ncbi:MAG: cellulase family glycosylhydrolase [Gemmatimonadota bacterium]|nr:MAG: cellulase family glycosylhydrolase [Gemmatimonadota bacterium]
MRHITVVGRYASDLKYVAVSLLLVGLLASAGCTPSFEGYTTSGDRIIDRATGEPVHLIGFGLGGWLLPEGYMWGIRALDRPWQFEQAIEDLIGAADAAEFWRRYHDNYVTEQDFRAMAAIGVNSIRPALLASKLMPREQPEAPPYTFSDEGFRFLDSVVTWGTRYKMGIIWDMHGAPGAQNAENISDSDGEARLWTEPDIYWPRMHALWRRIAERYAGNPYIIGYDLLNEPLLRRYEGIGEADLRTLYVELTETIREVDTNGIIFIEGDDWAQNFRMLEPIDWDPHLVLAFHSYPPTSSDRGLARWDSLRTRYDVPLWHGETGEVGAPFDRNRESTTFLRSANVGWSWWTHKKIARETQPWHCPPTQGFQRVLDYWQGRAERPTAEQARAWLFDQAEKVHSRYCDFLPDMVASLDGLDPDGWLSIREMEAPAIYLQPVDTEIEVGDVAVLRVRATGYPVEYTWLHDGQVVEAGAGPRLAIVPESEAEAGIWQVVASNQLGADTSESVRVEVRPFAGMEVPRAAAFGAFTPIERLVTGAAMPAPDDLFARWALRWDDDGLHGRIEVTDAVLRNQDGRPYHNDGVEIYLDPDNAKALGYQADDVQIRIIRGGSISADRGVMPQGFSGTQREVAGGYVVEFTLPFGAEVSPGTFIGIDVHVVDNDDDRREHKVGWAAEDDNAYRSPASLGTVRLVG